jgi:hypothetical protein
LNSGKSIAVIGGGAAGFFAAIHAAQSNSHYRVVIFEKSNKVLAKVKISGGGRCNVTHNESSVKQLVENYPRGGNRLKKVFGRFSPADTVQWFEKRGVPIKTESDGRMFPISNQSQSIIDALLNEANQRGVEVLLQKSISRIEPDQGKFILWLKDERLVFDKVIIATGGSPTMRGFEWLDNLKLNIIPPLPSLFTFNVPRDNWADLSGISMPEAEVRIPELKLRRKGPVLITHWGFSGPAALALSSIAARDLFRLNYQFEVQINWTGIGEEEIRSELKKAIEEIGQKKVWSFPLFQIPSRLWRRILEVANVPEDRSYGELVKKEINRLIVKLSQSSFQVSGKTTFKEEFVTSGGIDLDEVQIQSFESKKHPGLYCIGEVTNVDALTGGFNFQYAWASGYLSGLHAGSSEN